MSAELADLTELAEVLSGRANHHRCLSERARLLRIKEYHAGMADAHDADVRCIRALIASREPVPSRPALRLVTKEMV